MTEEAILILVAGVLLATGVLASLVAARLRLPALVLFLGIGMLIGTDGLGWIDFENYELARFIGTVALLLILFGGGLAAGFTRSCRFCARRSRWRCWRPSVPRWSSDSQPRSYSTSRS